MNALLSACRTATLKTLLTVSVILVLLSGCGRDKSNPEPEFAPVGVETSALIFTTPISADLTGKIINEDKQPIIDHGFVYGLTDELDISKSSKISLGANIVSGFFTAKVTDLQLPLVNGVQSILVLRAYVTDKKGTRYGTTFSTYFRGTVTTGVKQEGGKAGDLILVRGVFRGLKAENIKSQFCKYHSKDHHH